jgi:O-antigen/teichoic acid export membrane protein
MINARKIAKNTILVWLRMFIILIVSLFTSRVILDKIGISDFTILGVIGSIIGIVSFFNGTLSTGTSRFISFEISKEDKLHLKETFGTIFLTHILLSFVVILISEFIGAWYIYNKLMLNPFRINTAFIVLQISILTAVITLLQVPLISVLLAQENMNLYAYLGIFEAVSKLGILYLLSNTHLDKLILYTCLLALIQIIVFAINILYVINNFEAARGKLLFNKSIFKSLINFSFWNIFANLTNVLTTHGIILLQTIFFSPIITASQLIANQVYNAIMMFVNNIRNVLSPQIIKSYSKGYEKDTKYLVLQSSLIIFYILLLLGLPAIFIMRKLMDFWLIQVPIYAVIFTQYLIISGILSNFSSTFYIQMVASGNLKKNSIYSFIISSFLFFILYLLFNKGFDVMWSSYYLIFISFLFSFLIKPIILFTDENYLINDFFIIFKQCFKVAFLSTFISLIPYYFIQQNSIYDSLLIAFISFLSILFSSFIFMDIKLRKKITINIKRTLCSSKS